MFKLYALNMWKFCQNSKPKLMSIPFKTYCESQRPMANLSFIEVVKLIIKSFITQTRKNNSFFIIKLHEWWIKTKKVDFSIYSNKCKGEASN